MDLVELRPVQLASVLKALVGAEEMQRKMIEAIGMEKTVLLRSSETRRFGPVEVV